MATLWQDIRFGLRMLMKKPGFTAAAVFALAVGIGANTAIFSVVNAVLLRPLNYREPERLVTLNHFYASLDLTASVSIPGYMDYRQAGAFEETAAFYNQNFNLVDGGEPERVQGRRVTANFFSMLGFEAARGRTILAEEDHPDAPPVAVLSNGLWQRRFGADPNLVGRTITLSNRGYTVVGVMPASFRFGNDELWTPIAFTPEQTAATTRGNEFLGTLARLRPGVTLEGARAEINTIASRIRTENPETYPADSGWTVTVQLLHEQVVGSVRSALLVLLGAVGFLLLIACANVANLLLARSAARAKEIALRSALGASRLRLVRQLLVESVMLGAIGGGLGLLAAFWGVDLLVALNPDNIPRATEIGIDARVLSFTLLLSLLTGVLFGLVPALQASKTDLTGALKEGGRNSMAGGARLRSARSLLVVTEIAVALMLLIGAGLLIKSFARLLDTNPGFQTENVLTMQIAVPATKYREPTQVRAFYAQTLEGIRNLPGVESVGAVSNLPLSGSVWSASFDIEGLAVAPGASSPHSDLRAATGDYFQTLRIPLQRGRYFTGRDNADDAPPVAIIDETLARRYWPNEDPIGKRVALAFDQEENNVTRWREIVGVVGAVRHVGLDADLRGQAYYPHAQSPRSAMTIVIRTGVDPASLIASARGAVRAVDVEQPVYGVRTMSEVFNRSVAQKRFSVFLLGIFAVAALLLAAVGLYGVMAYTVSTRTHEIGIRIALGAGRGDVLRMVVGQGMLLAVVGVGVGLAGAFALTRVMTSLLYGVSATDPLTFAGVSILLTAIALLASYIPARKATKVDPMVALRYE